MLCAEYHLEIIEVLCRGCRIRVNFCPVIKTYFLGCRMPRLPHKAMQQGDSHGHIYLALQ